MNVNKISKEICFVIPSHKLKRACVFTAQALGFYINGFDGVLFNCYRHNRPLTARTVVGRRDFIVPLRRIAFVDIIVDS